MIYQPSRYQEKDGRFMLGATVSAVAHPALDKPVWKDIFTGHAFRRSTLTLTHTDEPIFRIGEVEAPALDGYDYAVRVEENGVCIRGKTEKDLLYGFLLWLDSIECVSSKEISCPCYDAAETPSLSCRMVHYCIFPETELWEVHRFVRYAGALRYTHLIVEFWGMYRYELDPALSWSHAFTKDDLRPILDEARDLGMEVIPMLNHWGHASGCRVMHGKHSVLDNDPSLAYLFSPDGWRWSIEREETRVALRKMRHELIELCGEGEYFHIGCDEAYGFCFTDESMKEITDYFSYLADELEKEGRRAIIWGDMFLSHRATYNKENRYDANAPTLEAEEKMLSLLDKRLLIADWQYHVKAFPAETSVTLKEAGFDLVICPWQETPDIENCVKTAKEYGLCGVMHTTWHTLSAEMKQVLRTAILSVQGNYTKGMIIHTCAAALLRKVYFVDGDYRKAGWAKQEIGVIT